MFFFILVISFISIVSYYYNFSRLFFLYTYVVIFFFFVYISLFFNKLVPSIVMFNMYDFPMLLNVNYMFCLDGITLCFEMLSVFLSIFCLLCYWYLSYRIYLYLLILTVSLFLLCSLFSTLDLFLLYIYFEAIILPIFLLIGIWGSRSRKIYASYLFFFYTMVSSLFILLGILVLYFTKGSTNMVYCTYLNTSMEKELLLFILFFLGFSVKVPIVPIHIWLPEAHVEAPTVGSVILAGILLKLGTYVFLRFLIPVFSYPLFKCLIFIWVIAFIGLLFSSLSALSQIDIKKIVAYSSIAHMNFLLIGLFSGTFLGVSGAFFFMLGHAIVSSSFFFLVGALYDRYKTRLLFYYGGLVVVMPLYSVALFVCVLANLGFPGTVNFVGEFVILLGTFSINSFIIILVSIVIILTVLYSLFFYTRVMFGPLRVFFIRYYCDLTRRETYIILPFCVLIIVFGLFPRLLFDISIVSIITLI